jgi:hypothetical protein
LPPIPRRALTCTKYRIDLDLSCLTAGRRADVRHAHDAGNPGQGDLKIVQTVNT